MFRRNRREADLDAEIRAHLAMETQRRIDAGETPEAARAAALKDLGSPALVKEHTREAWGWPALSALAADVRFGLRLLRKSPALTVTAVFSLAIGIGATTSVFGLVNSAMLRPLPSPNADRLTVIWPTRDTKRWILFYPVFSEIRASQRLFDALFAVSDEQYLKVQFEGEAAPAYVSGSFISGDYFPALGLTPAAGRLLREDEDRLPGSPGDGGCAAVIGHDLWTRRFGGSSAVLGRKVRVRNAQCAIVGVAPSGFQSHLQGFTVDIWNPMRQAMDPKLFHNRRLAFFSGIMGRLRPGASKAAAEAELTALFRRFQPPDEPRPPVLAINLLDGAHGLVTVGREYGMMLKVLLWLAGVVLLIAAANTANLLMARAATRAAEFSTRAALGAGRGRLIRQLITEAILLSMAGGVAGLAISLIMTPRLGSFIKLGWLTLSFDTSPDLRVALAAIAATAIAALLGGLLPALRLSRTSLQEGMAGSGRNTGARQGQRIAGALVVAQMALSLLLLCGSGLLLRTMERIAAVNPGFSPDHVVAINLRDESPPATNAEVAARYRTVEDRLAGIPGVESASLSWLGLFGGSDLSLAVIDPERPGERVNTHVDYVSARYFETTGMRIVRGRGFLSSDREGALRVAVVNQALVRERFAGREAIGARIALDYRDEAQRPFTIVGIVADSKYNDVREAKTAPMIWAPLAQFVNPVKFVLLRTRPGNEARVEREAHSALASAAPNIMVRRVTTLAAHVDDATGRERMLLGLAAGFSWLALALAAVGLYGTLAYSVTRRSREIGVRMAMGARPGDILRVVVGRALLYIACAFVPGIPLALALGRVLRPFLFQVEPVDLPSLAAACLVLLVAGLAAAYIPARRAARTDPVAALRS